MARGISQLDPGPVDLLVRPPVRPRQAWLTWSVGVLGYVMAVFNRSSLAVSGLAAQHRFGIGATGLALFSVLQLAVYAGLQVPVGVLVDRYGSRRLLLTGAALMAAGQLCLAEAHSVAPAVAARVLVGSGDAMTFISVLRLVPAWFPTRQVPLVTQLTGIVGQLGQVAAAYPLVALLGVAGWAASFGVAAGAGLAIGLLILLLLRELPPGAVPAGPTPLAEVRSRLRTAWSRPGTRLGLWTHFTTQFSGTAFGLLWGYPFLVRAEGLSPAAASGLLTLLVVTGMLTGPLLGALTGHWPLRRSVLVLAITGATMLGWTVVLAWPGRAPLGVLALLAMVLGTNGPGSMIGFDYARTANPGPELGSASGMVNVGGFTASLVTILAIGVVLDLLSPGGSAYSRGAFRLALCVQYPVWALGLAGVVRQRRRVRAWRVSTGVVADPFPAAVRRRLRSR